MHVIGTAGHVDHGKSTLIEALSGVHPDRLKEEREREMTIELGFAWMTLPPDENGEVEEIGIVDVPGHRDFIENMLAGIGGIDAALFVVAADEGVMPQTREHLAILNILQIQGGVVALTKVDMIDDPDWLDLVESDVQQALVGTVLEQAPIVRVSARNGFGLDELRLHLREVLAKRPPRLDLNKPRLPVDRVFTMAGFGTVVTGTLSDGQLHVGDEIEVLPGGLRGRVRGLQTHKQKEQVAVPGSRTAVNISGITLEEVRRGDLIAHPGDYRATGRMDVRFELLSETNFGVEMTPLKHNTEVKLFIGTAEVVARVRLLGVDELLPGQQGWLQLELQDPVVAARGDRFILRRPSPGETLGGGSVVDPQPKGRHKRFAAGTLASLEAISAGTPADILFQALLSTGAAPLKEVFARANLEASQAATALDALGSSTSTNPQIINLEGKTTFSAEDLVIAFPQWQSLAERILKEISSYHQKSPLRRGLLREELKSRIKDSTRGSARLFNLALRKLLAEGRISEAGPVVFLPEHTIQFTAAQQESVDRMMKRFASDPYSPPSVKECQAETGEELFAGMLETGLLVLVAPDVVFSKEVYEKMVADVRRLIEQNGSLTVAQGRDHFNTSRRYVLALLEHLDAIGVTVRSGDERRLKR